MDDKRYYLVPDCYIPIFVFEDTSVLEQDQADQIHDGLNQINFGRSVQKAAKIAGGVLAAVCLSAAIALAVHWYRLKQESEESWGDDVGEYTGVPSGVESQHRDG